MASKYLITKNVLQEYDERTIGKQDTINFKERLYQRLSIVKEKKEAKKEEQPKIKYLEFVLLTRVEYDTLIEWYGTKNVLNIIQRLNDYIGSKWEKYKSHYHTILNWFNQKWIAKINSREVAKPIEIKKEVIPMTDEQKEKAKQQLLLFRNKFWNGNTTT